MGRPGTTSELQVRYVINYLSLAATRSLLEFWHFILDQVQRCYRSLRVTECLEILSTYQTQLLHYGV
jgi:hypothetical protein